MDWYRLLPPYWIQNYPTSEVWDAELNEALDHYPVRVVCQRTAMVGPFKVWISNHPYASGTLYSYKYERFLPKVSTRIRLMNVAKQKVCEQEAKFIEFIAMIKAREGTSQKPLASIENTPKVTSGGNGNDCRTIQADQKRG